jgi:hypothetical protein
MHAARMLARTYASRFSDPKSWDEIGAIWLRHMIVQRVGINRARALIQAALKEVNDRG